ncbi:hypothetical protein VTJ04DRAFT_8705 [Mycothermus thermophilus]|uniref:uncharacterized protein n=1 Tax=Humicola insolens TaxID=85995 RepID=UPI0037432BC4
MLQDCTTCIAISDPTLSKAASFCQRLFDISTSKVAQPTTPRAALKRFWEVPGISHRPESRLLFALFTLVTASTFIPQSSFARLIWFLHLGTVWPLYPDPSGRSIHRSATA